MKERELLIRSVVSLMSAVEARLALVVVRNGVGSLVGARPAQVSGLLCGVWWWCWMLE